MRTERKGRTNGGLRNLACAGVAALTIGAASADNLDDYFDGNSELNYVGAVASDIKDASSFWGCFGLGLLSHEYAHELVGNAFGLDASYNPLKDPFATYHKKADNNLEKALLSGAGLFAHNAISALVVNSDIDLKESPCALGYLGFAAVDNLRYALVPEIRGKGTGDTFSISEATGVPQEVMSGLLIASTLYLGKKVLDSFKGNDVSGLISNISPHFGIDGSLGIQYNVKDNPWSISAGVNAKKKSVEFALNVSLGGKR